MKERRLSYQEIEDRVATLILFENEEILKHFRKPVEELPDGAEPGDQYRSEFEDGELVAMEYDEELTKKKQEEFKDAREKYNEMLEDN